MSRQFFGVLLAVTALLASAAHAAGPVTAPAQRMPAPAVKGAQIRPAEKAAPADALNLTQSQGKKDPLDMFSGGPAGFLLSQYLKTAVDLGPDAARRQRMALKEIQRAAPEVKQQLVSELVAAYQRLPEGEYDRRWLLVDTMAQLDRQEAVDHLGTIALSSLPPERLMRKGSEWSSRDEEISIRLAAVRGLTKLSARQVQAADARLATVAARSTVPAIRKQAIQGYVDAPVHGARTGSLDAYRKSAVFTRRVSDLKRQLPVEAHRVVDEVVLAKPDLSVPEEVRKAVQDKRARKEPLKKDPPPAVLKGGKP